MKNALNWVARDRNGYVYSYHVKPKLGIAGSFFVGIDNPDRGYISHGSELDFDVLKPMECVPKHILLSRMLIKDLEYFSVYTNNELQKEDYDFDWHDVTIKMSDDGEFMVQSNGLTSISAEIVGAFENLRLMQQNERRKYFENETTNNNQQ